MQELIDAMSKNRNPKLQDLFASEAKKRIDVVDDDEPPAKRQRVRSLSTRLPFTNLMLSSRLPQSGSFLPSIPIRLLASAHWRSLCSLKELQILRLAQSTSVRRRPANWRLCKATSNCRVHFP